jgi:flagellar biosynthesis protein FliR/FlhB
MSDKSSKTEQASQYKLRKARDKGQVGKSQDLSGTVVLVIGMIMTFLLTPMHARAFQDQIITATKDFNFVELTNGGLTGIMNYTLKNYFIAVVPIMVAIFVAGFVSAASQVGFHFSTEPLIPKIDKINPIEGFKRLFSLKGFMQTFIAVLKMILIIAVTSSVLLNEQNTMVLLNLDQNPMIMAKFSQMLWELIMKASITLIAIAVIDFAYQKWQFTEDQKMSKQDQKDEYKETEGNPEIKGKMKQIQRQAAQKRGLKQAVADADVVVTNPFHIAVALKYERGEGKSAPIVVAKGARLLAQRIREFAKEADVEIIRNIPLARALYKECKVDREIIPELYVAVAEILAIVFKKSQKKKTRALG